MRCVALLVAARIEVDGDRMLVEAPFAALAADGFPAAASFSAATVWVGEGSVSERVVLLGPDGEALYEAGGTFSQDGGVHVRVHRFEDVLLPEAGEYTLSVLNGDEEHARYAITVGG